MLVNKPKIMENTDGQNFFIHNPGAGQDEAPVKSTGESDSPAPSKQFTPDGSQRRNSLLDKCIVAKKTPKYKSFSVGKPVKPGAAVKPLRSGYLFDRDKMVSEVAPGMNVSFPVNVDTEFVSRVVSHTIQPYGARKHVSTQVRGINDPTGLILVPQDLENPRHPVATSGFDVVDYLGLIGHDVHLERCESIDSPYPTFEIVIYGHFLLAEVSMIFKGEFKEDIKKLLRAPDTQDAYIWMRRRLMATQKTRTPKRVLTTDSIQMPWLLTVDGCKYIVKVCFMDSCAVHGEVTYAKFCQASDVELKSKGVWKDGEISRMDEMYHVRPEDYDAYALGDLHVYDALEANSKYFKLIYKALGIGHLFTPPGLTIGATVIKMFAAVLRNKLGLDDREYKEFSETYLEPVSASHLCLDGLSTKALLAKVEGGRCRNNRPTDVSVASALVDMDISGCYGEGQRNQLYPIGRPLVLAWDAKSAVNEYWSLRVFLEKHGAGTTNKTWKTKKGELVPGCWNARVSTFELLSVEGDFLASWFVDGKASVDLLGKYVQRDMLSDSEKTDNEFNVDDGMSKIFNKEVKNGLITHDFIDWLMFVASQKQRKELLDGLFVTASMVYPASKRVDSFEEFKKVNKAWKGRNIHVDLYGKTDGECHAWFGFNMADLIINPLLANRKLHKKKTPLDILFKLCINTLYGDMVSKFFNEANVVVGNNITARARSLAYYMEKGFNGFQTVTDGTAFELNNVLRSFGKGSVVETANLHRMPKRKRNVKHGSIIEDGSEVSLTWVELSYLDGDKVATKTYPCIAFGDTVLEPYVTEDGGGVVVPAMAWIDKAAMEHLQRLFPDVAVLHGTSSSLKPHKNKNGTAGWDLVPRTGQFEFEAKQFYDKGAFHGSANYLLTNPNKEDDNLKMRSYEAKKTHDGFVNGEITDRYSDGNNPANDLLRGIARDGTVLERQQPFVKEAILKLSEYKQHSDKHDRNGIEPGDNYLKPGMLKEFSLSRFTFQTLAQCTAWEKAVARRKDKYGQSLESFFINEDGTLNDEKMNKTVDAMIAAGCMEPFKELAKRDNIPIEPHPGFEDYTWLKQRFNR